MVERIMEIILFVISNTNDIHKVSDDNIQELENRGYTKSEISTAFSWIYERSEIDSIEKFFGINENTKGFRIFHSSEKDLFTNEAFNDLTQYMSLGLISPAQVDLMIERLTISGLSIIDSRFLKNYIVAIHFDSIQKLNKPGRAMLIGDDTIN